MDMESTVEPELYSTTVLVFPGTTLFSSRFNAVYQSMGCFHMSIYMRLTWHGLDIVCWMHRHHLGIYAYSILTERVEAVRDFNQRQWR